MLDESFAGVGVSLILITRLLADRNTASTEATSTAEGRLRRGARESRAGRNYAPADKTPAPASRARNRRKNPWRPSTRAILAARPESVIWRAMRPTQLLRAEGCSTGPAARIVARAAAAAAVRVWTSGPNAFAPTGRRSGAV
jgi:hypothetical protein